MKNHTPMSKSIGSKEENNVVHHGVSGGFSAFISTPLSRRVFTSSSSLFGYPGVIVVNSVPSFNVPLILLFCITTLATFLSSTCFTNSV